MTDTDTQAWPDRTLTEAQQKNREAASLMPVSRSGALPMDFAQMVDYAKFMATARGAVGAHLNGNVGACLAVMEIAKQFDICQQTVCDILTGRRWGHYDGNAS